MPFERILKAGQTHAEAGSATQCPSGPPARLQRGWWTAWCLLPTRDRVVKPCMGVSRPRPLGVDSARAQRQSSGRLTELMCPSVGVTLAPCFLSPGFDAGKGSVLTSNPEKERGQVTPRKDDESNSAQDTCRPHHLPKTDPNPPGCPQAAEVHSCYGAGKKTDLGASPSNSNKEENRCWFCWVCGTPSTLSSLLIYKAHAGWLEKIWKIQKV